MKTKLICYLLVSMFFGILQSSAQNCTGFTTFTIGGWGTQCNGGNPGCYRDANFNAAFPDGLTIGGTANSLTLTSSAAVGEFLPSGTQARALNAGTMVDPGGSYKNVLAGQLVALTLAVGFDAYDPNFSSNTQSFGSLVITSGTFAGMTVTDFLALANTAIGGTQTGYSFSDFNATASAINQNYVGGTIDLGFLACETPQPALTLVITSLCSSSTTAQVSATVTGGTGPYTFTLSNGTVIVSLLQTVTFSGLPAGNYTVIVTDSNGETSSGSDTIAIPLPNPILANTTITNVACFGQSNGSISVVATGGTIPLTILWSNGSTSFTQNNLAAGTYTAVITGALGCTLSISATVAQPESALLAATTQTNVTCFAGNNGSITATATGDTSPYTILWSNGSTSFTLNNLVAGTYTAVITDANGCTANVSATITQPATILASTNTTTNVSCFGGTTGSTTVTATGGTAPYTILWSNGGTTFTANNLAAGTYTAVITDANGCNANVSVTITQPATILASTNTTTNVSCFGETTGSTTVTATGGTAPYTILWSNGGTTFTANNLAAGTYTAVITDANGCTANVSVTITQPATILASTNTTTNVSCFGGTTGSTTVTATGGTAPYTILWSNGGTTFTANNLAAGTYTAVITDANGCTANVSVTITQPAMVLASTNTTTNVSCFGGATGSTTVTATGGTAPYTILWSNGGTTFTANNLAAGTYTAVITDANGCTANVSVTITQPATVLASTNTTTNVSCFGGATGSTTVTATGGTAPYTILWSNGGTTFTANNLAAGTYTAVITDANGCTANVSVTITQPATVLASTNTTTNVSCFGGTTGSTTVTATGGTAPYTILWSNGGTTFTANNLAAGTYTAVITDANGCTANVSVTITQPATALASTNTTTNVSCFGGTTGSTTVIATGGTAPYTILWSNGGTTFTATNLIAGTYTAVITDANGCTANVSVTITQPATVLASTNTTTNVSCFGGATGSTTVTATGGTAPYTILWSNGGTTFTANNLAAGTYTAVITDANGCTANVSVTITQPATALASTNTTTNVSCFGGTTGSTTVTATGGTAPYTILWSNGGTTFTANNLAAGTYTAVITDANGCTANVSVTITQPATVLASTNTTTNVSCFGGTTGSTTVTATGGTAPYTILWSNGGTTFTANNLAAGTYTAVITDANGCTANVSVTITQPATVLASTNTTTNVSCFGGTTGSTTVTATGGTAPYTILWSNGGTTFTANNLAAGTYTAVITDANGCTVNVSVTITQPATVLASTNTTTNVSCFGGTTGSTTVTATGGTAPYTILWSNGGTTFTANNLAAGTYTAVITDANECTSNVSVTITQPATALVATTTQTNVTCFAGNNGSITATVTGGPSPYTILWSNGSTSFTLNNLVAGTYTAVVTSANGCTANVSATITQPATALVATTTPTHATCCTGNDGIIVVVPTGGMAPYSILWSNGSTTFTINGLIAGTYTYVLTDANGCTSNGSAIIFAVPVLASTHTATALTCTTTSASATVTATGGTLPYTIAWSTGSTAFTVNNLTAGTYTYIVSDANGCQSNGTVTIANAQAIVASTTQTNVSCFTGDNGSVTATVAGGIAPYTILWSNGSTSFTINNLVAGTYTAVVTSANGCTANVSATVTQPATTLLATTTQSNMGCTAGSLGSITATVSGGTAPYTILWSNEGTTFTINNLVAGTYTGVISSADGCTTNVSATITQNAIVAVTSQINVPCYAGNNGSVTATVTGGTTPYTILWSNGSTSFTINNLVAGTYTAVVTSANGCSADVSATVTQPATALAITMSQTPITSSGGYGTAKATVTGGTGPYTYSWNSTPVQTTQTASLQVGWYTVVATDANGCTITGNVTLLYGNCFGFNTMSREGYAVTCLTNDENCYLNANFATSFPNGIVVGSGTRNLKFTSADAVRSFLPSNAAPRALNQGTMSNPSNSAYDNELAAQVVTTMLNIAFGKNADFSSTNLSIKDLYITSGEMEGLKVSQVLKVANTMLGGGITKYSFNDVNEALIAINGNYEEGFDFAYLSCSPPSNGDVDASLTQLVSYKVYPNPVTDSGVIEYALNERSSVSIQLYNVTGQLIKTIFEGNAAGDQTHLVKFNIDGMPSGVYFLRLVTNENAATKSVIISNN